MTFSPVPVDLSTDRLARWRRAASSGQLAGLGTRLQKLGLTQSAVEHVFGVRSVLQAPWHARVMQLQARAGKLSEALVVPPAALMAHLWVAGAHLERARIEKRLGDDFATLEELGLLDVHADRVSATVAIVPVGEALIVSDRADVTEGREIAQFADDSALHTIGALPEHALPPGSSWLDVGTGSAIAPLARPGLAQWITGTDINPRAIAMAELGAALSRIAHVRLKVADLLSADKGRDNRGERFRLITFNAPIPCGFSDDDARDHTPFYRYGESDIVQRFWREVPELLTPDGEVLTHSVLPDGEFPSWLDHLTGHISVVQYTPPGMEPAFGVSAWRPIARGGDASGDAGGDADDARAGTRTVRRHLVQLLSASAPHVTRRSLALPD